MRITRLSVARSCAVCERTLLIGERTTRFTPDGQNFVDVCPLCQDIAFEYGWLKEGSPTTPTVSTDRPLSGVSGEVVITIAWEISWYQYRVTPELAQPVRLEERGHELTELDPLYKDWNAHLDEHGRVVPNIARV